ncbi:hypothetical protein [Streptomyces sp. LUP47B]|uniref:hypothetical protein n=1 Tax=Streptomyces sp. LUP47B TaxID=1890286 RepID=UPI00114D207C|nr:hypothetical protein [Streptomyces sp. LUP47B]
MEDLNEFPDGVGASSGTDEARLTFQNDFAHAQMLVPDDVLDAATQVRISLADAYKRLTRLGRASAIDDQARDDLRAFLLNMWEVITKMQAVMRKDLGVGSGVPVPSERPGAYLPDTQ